MHGKGIYKWASGGKFEGVFVNGKQKGKGNFVGRRKPKDSVLNINKSIKDQFNNLRISDNDLYPSFFYYRKNKYLLKISKDNKKK